MNEHEKKSIVALTIPTKAEYLLFCRLVLTGLSRATPIGPEALSDLKLAVTEACSYAIRHSGENGAAGGTLAIRYELGASYLAVEVRDEGESFQAPAPGDDSDGLSEDRLGMALIRAVVDELEMGTEPDRQGSRISFTKRLP